MLDDPRLRDPYEWRCTACLDGEHLNCDFWRGCECAVRRGRDGHGVQVCESLLPFEEADDLA